MDNECTKGILNMSFMQSVDSSIKAILHSAFETEPTKSIELWVANA